MFRWLFDALFTRSQWKVIKMTHVHNGKHQIGFLYILQNQRGKVKRKLIQP